MAAGGEELEFLSVEDGNTETTGLAGTIEQQNIPRVDSEPSGAASGNTTTNAVAQLFNSAAHPRIAILHVFFKILAIIVYFIPTFYTISYVKWFIPLVIMFALDFWVVKNITGRLLVGLRWWNDISDDGESEWRFESLDDPNAVNSSDYSIFWYSMYINTLVWGFIGFWSALGLKLNNLVLIAVGLTLQSSNLVGYWKCSKDAKQKLEAGVQNFVTQNAMSVLGSRISNGFSFGR
mmetsp:Transcript_11339/g.12989  ORF Transcript_11339/g.12989 Transcript_11339/m.12989 type:complete len:235 (-) Transcript_11339:142-846(-)